MFDFLNLQISDVMVFRFCRIAAVLVFLSWGFLPASIFSDFMIFGILDLSMSGCLGFSGFLRFRVWVVFRNRGSQDKLMF